MPTIKHNENGTKLFRCSRPDCQWEGVIQRGRRAECRACHKRREAERYQRDPRAGAARVYKARINAKFQRLTGAIESRRAKRLLAAMNGGQSDYEIAKMLALQRQIDADNGVLTDQQRSNTQNTPLGEQKAK